jgi:hypothetical protein
MQSCRLVAGPLEVLGWGRGKLPKSIIASPMCRYTVIPEVGEEYVRGALTHRTGTER